jgi:hypothetical protein
MGAEHILVCNSERAKVIPPVVQKLQKPEFKRPVSVVFRILPPHPRSTRHSRRAPDLKAHQRLSIHVPMYPAKEPLKISTWRPTSEQAPTYVITSTLQPVDPASILHYAIDPTLLTSASPTIASCARVVAPPL